MFKKRLASWINLSYRQVLLWVFHIFVSCEAYHNWIIHAIVRHQNVGSSSKDWLQDPVALSRHQKDWSSLWYGDCLSFILLFQTDLFCRLGISTHFSSATRVTGLPGNILRLTWPTSMVTGDAVSARPWLRVRMWMKIAWMTGVTMRVWKMLAGRVIGTAKGSVDVRKEEVVNPN